MKLSEIAAACKLEKLVFAGDAEIEWAYCGDLMSDVMGHAREGALWITIQAHQNSVGVACLKDIAAVLFANGVTVEPVVLEKARREGVNLLRTERDAFTVCGELYALGIRSGLD